MSIPYPHNTNHANFLGHYTASSKKNRATACYPCAQLINSKAIKYCSVGQPYIQWTGFDWKVYSVHSFSFYIHERKSQQSEREARGGGGGGGVCEGSDSIRAFNDGIKIYEKIEGCEQSSWNGLTWTGRTKKSYKIVFFPVFSSPHSRLDNLFSGRLPKNSDQQLFPLHLYSSILSAWNSTRTCTKSETHAIYLPLSLWASVTAESLGSLV